MDATLTFLQDENNASVRKQVSVVKYESLTSLAW
jgi:hypothetical protein